MANPFVNDPFALIWEAFKNLYPGKDCECYFDEIDNPNNEDGVYGETLFGDDGRITVGVDCRLRLADAVEIFAHELAHVAAGSDADHGEPWAKAFDAIFEEYNRIGYERFDKHEKVEALDAGSCFREVDNG